MQLSLRQLPSCRKRCISNRLFCGPGSKGDFVPDNRDNQEVGIETAFKEFMLNTKKEAKEKQVLLLTGQAGSGKSTAVEKLKNYILTDYAQQRKKECGKTVVLLPVNLPSVSDPVGSVFVQGALVAFDGKLRPSQVDELKSLVQDENSNLELILLLNAYDEVPPDAQKNLYRTNNLEQYCPHKVILNDAILCYYFHSLNIRCSLLLGKNSSLSIKAITGSYFTRTKAIIQKKTNAKK